MKSLVVLVNDLNEFNSVQKICLKKGLKWRGGERRVTLNEPVQRAIFTIVPDNTMYYSNQNTFEYHKKPSQIVITFDTFMKNYGPANIIKKQPKTRKFWF
jgi:hypothetical protein